MSVLLGVEVVDWIVASVEHSRSGIVGTFAAAVEDSSFVVAVVVVGRLGRPVGVLVGIAGTVVAGGIVVGAGRPRRWVGCRSTTCFRRIWSSL